MNLTQPKTYDNKWYVWKNAIMKRLEFTDCNNTTAGYCTKNKTTEECMDTCKEGCSLGYNITLSNGERICANIKESKYQHINPYYQLTSKDTYPYLKNVEIETFVKKDAYKFPPLEGKNVFFDDLLFIHNVGINKNINIKPSNEYKNKDINVTFSENKTNPILIIPLDDIPFLSQFISVYYGAKISFNIPSTILFLRIKPNGLVHWVITAGTYQNDDYAVELEPVSKDIKIGDAVKYDQEFLIKILDSYIVYNSNLDLLEISNKSKDQVLANKNNIFKFTTNMDVNYCESGECKKVPISNLSEYGKYKNKDTYRNVNCWDICGKTKNKQYLSKQSSNTSSSKNYKYLIIGIVISVVLTILFLKIG
tara:strand:+ start:845 stop:1939 length:1095 start_codon:yes stop_codon:yes gene_type:complete